MMTPEAIKESANVSISAIANASAQHTEGIERIELTVEKNQDAPISSDHIQNTKLNWLEAVNNDVLKRLDRMEMRIYEMRERR